MIAMLLTFAEIFQRPLSKKFVFLLEALHHMLSSQPILHPEDGDLKEKHIRQPLLSLEFQFINKWNLDFDEVVLGTFLGFVKDD